MKAPVDQNQISDSLIIYYMLQFTFPSNGTARVEVAGGQELQYLTPGICLPLLLKHFSQSFSLSRDEHSVLSGTKMHWCSPRNMEDSHHFLQGVRKRCFYLAASEPIQKSDCFIWPPIHGRQCVQLFPLEVVLSCEQTEWSLAPQKPSPTSSVSDTPLHIPWHTGQGNWSPAAPMPPWAAAWARSAGGPEAVPKKRWQVRTQVGLTAHGGTQWTEDSDQLPWRGWGSRKERNNLG